MEENTCPFTELVRKKAVVAAVTEYLKDISTVVPDLTSYNNENVLPTITGYKVSFRKCSTDGKDYYTTLKWTIPGCTGVIVFRVDGMHLKEVDGVIQLNHGPSTRGIMAAQLNHHTLRLHEIYRCLNRKADELCVVVDDTNSVFEGNSWYRIKGRSKLTGKRFDASLYGPATDTVLLRCLLASAEKMHIGDAPCEWRKHFCDAIGKKESWLDKDNFVVNHKSGKLSHFYVDAGKLTKDYRGIKVTEDNWREIADAIKKFIS